MAPLPSPQPAAMMAAPSPAPTRAPSEKKPWKDDMVGRPRAASTSVACTFMDTSSAPIVVPKMKTATKKSGTVPASSGSGMNRVKAIIMAAVGRREPSLPMRHAGQRHGDDEAMAMVKMAIPRIAGSIWRRAWISGMCVAQMPVPRPADQKGVIDGKLGAQDARAAGAVWRQRLLGRHGEMTVTGALMRRISALGSDVLKRFYRQWNHFRFPIGARCVLSRRAAGNARSQTAVFGDKRMPKGRTGWAAAPEAQSCHGTLCKKAWSRG